MKTIRTTALIAAALSLTACAQMGAGFHKANDENTKRLSHYQDNLLLQAEHDLTAINACYLRAAGYVQSAAGPVKAAGGALNLTLTKVAEPSSSEGCTVMATALRTQSNMLTAFAPFIGQALLARVPAAPEEIVQAVLKDGMQFALAKYGIEAVQKVVTNGQLAQAQVAQAGIDAASKPPLVVDKPVVVQVPAGSSVLPTNPAPATPVAE